MPETKAGLVYSNLWFKLWMWLSRVSLIKVKHEDYQLVEKADNKVPNQKGQEKVTSNLSFMLCIPTLVSLLPSGWFFPTLCCNIITYITSFTETFQKEIPNGWRCLTPADAFLCFLSHSTLLLYLPSTCKANFVQRTPCFKETLFSFCAKWPRKVIWNQHKVSFPL